MIFVTYNQKISNLSGKKMNERSDKPGIRP